MAYTKRLRVDPSISVMDLQRVLLRQIDRSKEKGLFDCLKHPMNAPWSWKTAPCTAWLSKSADLLVDFLKIAPNGVLPSAKMRLALQRLLLEPKKKINTTAYDNDKFMDEVDARIRVLLSQARQLKKSGQSYDTAMRKSTMEDKELVDLILGHIKLDPLDNSAAELEDDAHCTTLAIWKPTKSSSSSKAKAEPELSPGNVFKRILTKSFSSPSTKEQSMPVKDGDSKMLAKESKKNKKKAGSIKPSGLYVGSLVSSTEEEGEPVQTTPVKKKRENQKETCMGLVMKI